MTAMHSALEFGIHVALKFTSSASEHFVEDSNENPNSHFDVCSEHARRDPTDHIHEEHDNDSSVDISAWKRNRPPFYKSVLQCATIAFRVFLLIGSFLGLVEMAFIFLILNTMYYCDWMDDTDPQITETVRTTRYVTILIGVLYIDQMMVLVLCTVFTWSAVRHSRILFVNTLFALVDISYRATLQLLHKYHAPFRPAYPVNILYILNVLALCYLMGRMVCPHSKTAALKVATKLCVHLIGIVITTFIFIYAIFPWFITLNGVPKLLVATIAPLLFLPSKLLGRLCVLRLRGVIHPSTAFALVSVIYAIDSVVARAMQADLAGFKMFVVFGLLHGIVHVLETLVVSTLDCWSQIACCRRKRQEVTDGESPLLQTPTRPNRKPVRSAYAQRLAADMSLQTMLHEPMAIILMTGLIEMYVFVYQPSLSPDETKENLVKLMVYVFTALFTEFFFNSLSVLLQTRYLNVPVIRVWEARWLLHLWVSVFTVLMLTVYATPYFLPVVREKYRSEGKHFNESCAIPFQ